MAGLGNTTAGEHSLQSIPQTDSPGPLCFPHVAYSSDEMDALYPPLSVPPAVDAEDPLGHSDAHEPLLREGYRLASDLAFRDVDPDEYTGLVISGGRAPEYLRYDEDLMRITRHFCEQDKPVGVVCHGIEIVAAADVIRGRNVTTVPKCRYDAEFSGATYLDEPVVVDGNMVCARTFWDNAPWMREFMKLLNAARDATDA